MYTLRFILFIFISLYFHATITIYASTTLFEIEDFKIIRFNEEMFIGKRKMQYKETDGYAKDQDNVYFVFEKLTDENFNFWEAYFIEQRDTAFHFEVPADTLNGEMKSVPIRDGIVAFKYSLDLAARSDTKQTIWIAYVTRKDPRQPNALSSYDIEMIVSVFIDKDSPITTHMGIARNAEYFRFDMQPHVDLAMKLHSFSATVSNMLYGGKQYMTTKPASDMRNIMLQHFKENKLENYIWLGDEQQRQRRSILYKNIDADWILYHKLLNDDVFDNPEHIIIKDFKSFETSDVEKIYNSAQQFPPSHTGLE